MMGTSILLVLMTMQGGNNMGKALKKGIQLVVIILLVLVSAMLLSTAISVANSEKLPGNTIAYPLFLECCELWLFGKKSETTLILACPHVDLVRLYPLPLIHPWYESKPVPGGLD